MKLLHFSDVHVQLPDWRTRSFRDLGLLRSVATAELWKGRGKDYDDAATKVAAIAADAERLSAHAICTGDLTQLGHPDELALARTALGALASDPERFTALPGNHDRFHWRGPLLFERHFPEQARRDLPGPVRVRLVGEVALIVLETATVPSWPIIARGRVADEVLRALPDVLARREVSSRCALVLTHHAPLLANGRPDWPWHGLHGGGDLLKICADGGVQAVLCGHVHERYDLPARAGRARVLCAGSSTERGHEGYWLLTVEKARLVSAEERSIGATHA